MDITVTEIVSPASNGGCGLKLSAVNSWADSPHVSPASNGGCGLKRGNTWPSYIPQGFTRQ